MWCSQTLWKQFGPTEKILPTKFEFLVTYPPKWVFLGIWGPFLPSLCHENDNFRKMSFHILKVFMVATNHMGSNPTIYGYVPSISWCLKRISTKLAFWPFWPILGDFSTFFRACATNLTSSQHLSCLIMLDNYYN